MLQRGPGPSRRRQGILCILKALGGLLRDHSMGFSAELHLAIFMLPATIEKCCWRHTVFGSVRL